MTVGQQISSRLESRSQHVGILQIVPPPYFPAPEDSQLSRQQPVFILSITRSTAVAVLFALGSLYFFFLNPIVNGVEERARKLRGIIQAKNMLYVVKGKRVRNAQFLN